MHFARFFTISRELSPTRSATTYVPVVIFSRGLAFLRVLLVAVILGNAGQREFGFYQPALALINWLVPLVLFGLADVAERYAARFEKDHRLDPVFRRHLGRLLAHGIFTIFGLALASPVVGYFMWGERDVGQPNLNGFIMVTTCGITTFLLALDIYIAAVLRGIRAYAAAAGMELIATFLLFVFSLAAAWIDGALGLLVAYAVALLVPVVYFGALLVSHFRSLAMSTAPVPPAPEDPSRILQYRSPRGVETLPVEPGPVLDYQPSAVDDPARYRSFARWSLFRLLLVMSFGLVSIWAVGHLAIPMHLDPHSTTAEFSIPYRIAELLAYVGITLWASVYGISARHWSHQQKNRAKVELFRIGKFGAVILTLVALVLLLARPLLALLLPSAYTSAIIQLLPPMLAQFIWYSLLAFSSTYADLQEAPWKGALLWFAALLIQLTLIFSPLTPGDPGWQVLLASSLAVAIPLLIFAPILLGRPLRLSATFIPLALLSLAPLSLFSPPWVVDYIAPPAMLAPIAFLYISGLLLRPRDKKALRRRFAH